MGLIEDCENYFGSPNLYEILHVQKNCSEKEVQKAYRKISLLVHPDRVDEDEKEQATKKFQVLAKVHFILSDKEKRAIYDETGEVDEEDSLSEDRDWIDYWRLLFPRIKESDIVKCLAAYRGSEDEKTDLKKWYNKFEGDMDKISECLIGYSFEDESRYREMISEMIKNDDIPEFKKFTKESASKRKARQRRYEREAKEAEEEKTKADDDLVGAIQKRANQRFEDMISHLENKYAKKSSSSAKSKKKAPKK